MFFNELSPPSLLLPLVDVVLIVLKNLFLRPFLRLKYSVNSKMQEVDKRKLISVLYS